MRFASAVVQSLQLKHVSGGLAKQRSGAKGLGCWLGLRFWLWLGLWFGFSLWFGFGSWSWLGFWRLCHNGFFHDFPPSWSFIFRTGWSATSLFGRFFKYLRSTLRFFKNSLRSCLTCLNNVNNWLFHV